MGRNGSRNTVHQYLFHFNQLSAEEKLQEKEAAEKAKAAEEAAKKAAEAANAGG